MTSTKTVAACAAVLFALLLMPRSGNAESTSGTYDSECIMAAEQQTALQCPSGAEAIAGRGGGKVPASRLATGGRAEEPQKREEVRRPGVSDTVVQQARSGFLAKRQKRVEAIIRQEIELTKRLIRNTRGASPEMAPRRLRLAQNYEDLLNASRANVRELDEPIFDARQAGNDGAWRKLVKQQNQRELQVTEFRDAAIKQYALIARDHADYKNRDEVLFRLAYMIDEQAADDRLRMERDDRPAPSSNEKQLREQARRVYRELIKNYPNSRYIPNAYLSFAEYYFQEGDMDTSLQFYERVAQYEDSEIFGYALYKMAWCYINLQDDRQAVSQFVRVIQYAEQNPDARIARPLARQARRELIPPFSRAFPPTQAWDFFQRVGGDEALEMMESLAEHYYNQGQWAQAASAYHSLMAENDSSHRLCFYQTRVAECSRRGRPKDEQVLELTRTVDLMNTYLEGTHPAENVTECRQVVAQMLMEMATNWHQEAVGSDTAPGTNDDETMGYASRLYALAIDTFPNLDDIAFEGWSDEARPTRYRVSYWAAELLWKRNQWEECGPAFDRVVEQDPGGEYLRDAAYAAVLCYNNLYEQQNEDDTQVRSKSRPASKRGRRGRKRELSEEEQEAQELERLQTREFTALETGMLNAYTRYVCYVTDSDELVTIKYRRARIFYAANHWPEAAVLFRDIAYNHSDDDLAPYAANQYLDCMNAISRLNQDRRLGCRDEMAIAVEDFLENDNLVRDEAFREQITQLQCGILWKRAEAYGEAEQFREAGDLYVRIYSDYRDECSTIGRDHDICEVLYNAAIMYESDFRIGPAIQIRRRLFRDCGDDSDYAKIHNGASPHAKKAIYQIGGNYHAIAAYTKAAEFYEEFSRRYSGEEDAPDSLANATVFRIGLGHDEQAIANAGLFEKNYGRRRQFKSQTATVVFSIGTIFMRRESWKAAEKHYQGFLKRYGKSASPDEVVQARTSLGYALWQQGGTTRSKADTEFSKAVGVADSGRTKGEGMEARLARYRKMVAASESAGDDAEITQRLVRMVNSVAKARFYLGEAEYEEFQSISFPNFRSEKQLPRGVRSWWQKKQGREKAREWEQMLRYLPTDERRTAVSSVQFNHWVEKSFTTWRTRKDDVRERAQKFYLSTVDEDVPEWEIAAAARMGDMLQSFMQALYDAPVDPSIESDQELVDIYRDALDQAAQPYRDNAIKAFQHCLGVATENRWFNEWSRSCEVQLNKLDPRAYPISDELRAEPAYNYSPLAVPSVINRLKTSAEREVEENRTAAEAQE